MSDPRTPGELAVSEAWAAAATDLGVEVEAPVVRDGKVIGVAYLPHFGCALGAAPTVVDGALDAPVLAGAYVSMLFAVYENYDRELFLETLKDWGWFGPEDLRPDWLD